MDAFLRQGYDKGKGTKGKSWGKGQGQKGGSWGKGKGAYYCEDDGWNNWSPQMLLKIVPAVDPDGFRPRGSPQRGKRFPTTRHRWRPGTASPISPRTRSRTKTYPLTYSKAIPTPL